MSQTPPPLPGKTLRRVLLIAKLDGSSLLFVAGGFALISACLRDGVGALIGCLIAGAGAMELTAARLLRHGDPRGIAWMVRSQLLVPTVVLFYCAIRLAQIDVAPLRDLISLPMRQEIEAQGIPLDFFLREMYVAVYLILSLVTLLYQGGLALYVYLRRARIAQDLATRL